MWVRVRVCERENKRECTLNGVYTCAWACSDEFGGQLGVCTYACE